MLDTSWSEHEPLLYKFIFYTSNFIYFQSFKPLYTGTKLQNSIDFQRGTGSGTALTVEQGMYKIASQCSGPYHFDADPDPTYRYHFDADPNPEFYLMRIGSWV